jgi:hypothetical protein
VDTSASIVASSHRTSAITRPTSPPLHMVRKWPRAFDELGLNQRGSADRNSSPCCRNMSLTSPGKANHCHSGSLRCPDSSVRVFPFTQNAPARWPPPHDIIASPNKSRLRRWCLRRAYLLFDSLSTKNARWFIVQVHYRKRVYLAFILCSPALIAVRCAGKSIPGIVSCGKRGATPFPETE